MTILKFTWLKLFNSTKKSKLKLNLNAFQSTIVTKVRLF